ncbi:MAG TPA: YetF domain-containing protein [Acidimicrobiales bacterium]|nr:YetF domain-containing protein [Acidimicrobiales bacterium]
MLHQVFDAPSLSGAGIIAAKTAVIYLFLIAGLRLLGKRELGQMSLYDLVMIIVLGNAVQNAMINNDNTLVGGLVAATVLLVMNRVFNIASSRSKRLEHFMTGEPVLIVSDGTLLPRPMKRQGITVDQVMAALREHGIEDLHSVHMAVLEVDGTISVVPRTAPVLKSKRHYRAMRLP